MEYLLIWTSVCRWNSSYFTSEWTMFARIWGAYHNNLGRILTSLTTQKGWEDDETSEDTYNVPGSGEVTTDLMK